MNTKDKDFIDNFFDFFEPCRKAGVRFWTVIIYFAVCFVAGSFFAPTIIKSLHGSLLFEIEFLQTSPLEPLFNYLKIGFFFALFFTLPFFIYQFGKLKIDAEKIEDKINLLYVSLITGTIFVVVMILVSKFLFPFIMFLLYGLNLNSVSYTTSLSAIVSSYIFILFLFIMLALLPLIRSLIKKSLLFNYATLIKYRKLVMVYCAVFAGILALPLEIIALGLVFLTFFFWYKVIVNFSKKRD